MASGLSREERAYQYVLTHAIPGDPDSILDTFDMWCSKVEFISNIGPKKGENVLCSTTALFLYMEITIIGVGLLCAGKILDRLLLEHSPLSVLELGAHCGYSTVRIARVLPLGAKLYSIEMDQNNAAIAEKIIRLAGFDDSTVRKQEEHFTVNPVYPYVMELQLNVSEGTHLTVYYRFIFVIQVELIVNPSDEVIPKLHSEYGLERLDFVFMDHWKKCYAPDLQVTFCIKMSSYSEG